MQTVIDGAGRGLLDLFTGIAVLTAGCLLFIVLAVVATYTYDFFERRRLVRHQRETACAQAALTRIEERHKDEIRCMGGRRHLEVQR